MTKSIICPLFLKGLAPLSASPNAGALILKRIGIRCYWRMVKLNWISVTVLLVLSSVMPCLCFLSANATLIRWEGWLLIVRWKLYSFQRKNSWLRRHAHRWLLHFPWRSVFCHFPYFYQFLVCLLGSLHHVEHSKNSYSLQNCSRANFSWDFAFGEKVTQTWLHDLDVICLVSFGSNLCTISIKILRVCLNFSFFRIMLVYIHYFFICRSFFLLHCASNQCLFNSNLQIRGTIGDFILGVFAVFQGMA